MLSKIIEHLEHFNKGFSVSKYLETYYNYDDSLVQTKEDFEVKLFYCYVIACFMKEKHLKDEIINLQKENKLKDFYLKKISNDDGETFNKIKTMFEIVSIIHTWLNFKQIYKFDNDAYQTILESKTKDITFEELKALKLPCDCFAVENEMFYQEYKIDSFMIDRYFNEEKNLINLKVCFFIEKPAGTFIYNINIKENETLLTECPKDIFPNVEVILKLLMYLAQPKVDIIKNAVVKPKNSKNKDNEIPKHFYNVEYQNNEVGCVLGSTIRNYRYIYKNKNSNNKDKKRIVSPHFRQAHYQGYWVGKGRTEYITKLIKPIYVLGGSKNAVLHKVK